jgi:hypothetical protein
MLTNDDYVPLPAADSRPADAVASHAPEPDIDPPRYPLNHPKSYVGVVPAVATTTSQAATVDAITDHIVANADAALRGAAQLGLITTDTANHPQLTARGRTVNRLLVQAHDSPEAALDALAAKKGTHTRFYTYSPTHAEIAALLPTSDPSLAYLTALVRRAYDHDHFSGPYTLPTLVVAAATVDPTFTIATFLRHDPDVRARVLETPPDADTPHLRTDALASADVYRGTTTQQVKSLLYHCGVFETTGTDVGRLSPPDECWHHPHPAGGHDP